MLRNELIIIRVIVRANRTRKRNITEMIMRRNSDIVGIYRLTMKTGSDNFRASAIQEILYLLLTNKNNCFTMLIY